MSLYAVRYLYSDDTAARDEHRPAHREFLSGLAQEGVVVASGPLSDEPSAALLLLEGESVAEIRDLLSQDPFAQQGIIETVEVREWDVVIGSVG